ncbi:MAG TPA: hypothetical protein VK941_04210 [Gillisia sp.]|nr:hypothetical protein [Gillisia sp.]
MKRILLLVFIIILSSGCSSDDDAGDLMQNLASVLSVDLPETFVYGHSYEIEIVYKRPTSCHTFTGLDLSQDENEITIGVVTSFRTSNPNCVETGNLEASALINFVAERDDFYIFKFWQGRNAAGTDQFLTIEVPVTQPGVE